MITKWIEKHIHSKVDTVSNRIPIDFTCFHPPALCSFACFAEAHSASLGSRRGATLLPPRATLGMTLGIASAAGQIRRAAVETDLFRTVPSRYHRPETDLWP